MPTPSANPLRLQIIDRVYAVLKAITAGASFWYTPGQVEKRFVMWEEAIAFPCYSVSEASGGSIELAGIPANYDEVFYFSVKGSIQDQSDTVTPLNKCIRDVRKAIMDDAANNTTFGSLGFLAVQIEPAGPPDTDNGYLSLEGFGFFDMKFSARISGTFSEL